MNEKNNLVEHNYTNYYFIGIGGIGMSSLARYFISNKYTVGGYDKVFSDLTSNLESEGALIHYQDNVNNIPDVFLNPSNTLVVYTPAIPSDNEELNYFLHSSFKVVKRAELLGFITVNTKCKVSQMECQQVMQEKQLHPHCLPIY